MRRTSAMLAASPAGSAGVEEFSAAGCGHPAQFHGDVGFGERVGDALMGADRRRPDAALPGVLGCLIDRVPSDPAAQRAHQDSFRVQCRRTRGARPLPATPIEGVLPDCHIVEEHAELFVGRHDRRVDPLKAQAWAVGWHDEQ